jgi:hypothetical protein
MGRTGCRSLAIGSILAIISALIVSWIVLVDRARGGSALTATRVLPLDLAEVENRRMRPDEAS